MQIENPQIKLGLRHIISGLIVILNTLVGPEAQPETSGPTTAVETPEAPARRGRKAKAESLAPEPAAPAAETTPAPASVAEVASEITHDTLRVAFSEFIKTPRSGGVEGAKKLLSSSFSVGKISEVKPEQLEAVLKTVTEATAALKGSEEL